MSPRYSSPVVADFDADGDDDIVSRGYGAGEFKDASAWMYFESNGCAADSKTVCSGHGLCSLGTEECFCK